MHRKHIKLFTVAVALAIVLLLAAPIVALGGDSSSEGPPPGDGSKVVESSKDEAPPLGDGSEVVESSKGSVETSNNPSPLGDAVDNNSLTWTTGGTTGLNWFGQSATWYYGGDAAQSGPLPIFNSTWLGTTVTGPGQLSFYWKTNGYFTPLRFGIDYVEQPGGRISGDVDWAVKNYTIPAGTHTLTWQVDRGILGAASDCGWVDKVSWVIPLCSLAEAVDSTSLTFTTGGDSNWYGQGADSYYGGDAARSGAIYHSQSTWMQTSVTGSGQLSFYWKVSSETNYDYLRLYIDGALQPGSISGNVDWAVKNFTLPAGAHTLRWVYSKDGSVSSLTDCGWVDKISWVTPLCSLAEAVDNTSLTFTTGGDSNWYGQGADYYYGGDAARSGAIYHNQSTWMQTSVTGSGQLSFYWKVSSEAGYDYLRFYIDGALQPGSISGGVGWAVKNFTLPAGAHTLRWVYSKDYMVSSLTDCGWVDKISWVTPLCSLGEAVDNTSLTLTTGGDSNWFGQGATSHYGGDAAQSGAIYHSQSTWMQTSVTGPGPLSFYWKVSSEAGYDYLRFYIDGALQPGSISGNVDWAVKNYTLTPGAHTLRWVYSKDSTVSSLSDCGWVDRVQFASTAQASVYISPASLALSTGQSGTVAIRIDGVQDLWGAEIWLNYNKDVVHVASVADGGLGTVNTAIDNVTGCTKMIWVTTTSGQTGNFVFANVTLTAVGNSGTSSPLDLDVKSLTNGVPAEIPRTVTDGTFTVRGTTPPPPVAVDDSYSVTAGNTLNVPAPGVLTNDTNPDQASLSAVLVSNVSHGAPITLNADGSFAYTPNSGYTGTDSFTYKATDGTHESNVATVTITINPVTTTTSVYITPPNIAVGPGGSATAAINIDGVADLWGAEIWLNYNKDVVVVDSIAPGDLGALTTDIDNSTGCTKIIWVTLTGPGQSGNFIFANITLRAVGNPGASCPLDLDVKSLTDGVPAPIDHSVTDGFFTISGTTHQPPVAVDDSYCVPEGDTLNVCPPGVLVNDMNPDQAPLSAVLVTDVCHGTLTLNADGSFTYDPDCHFTGTDSFTYKATDGEHESNIATVTITVEECPTPPIPEIATGVLCTLGLVAIGGFFLLRRSRKATQIAS